VRRVSPHLGQFGDVVFGKKHEGGAVQVTFDIGLDQGMGALVVPEQIQQFLVFNEPQVRHLQQNPVAGHGGKRIRCPGQPDVQDFLDDVFFEFCYVQIHKLRLNSMLWGIGPGDRVLGTY
jgi:hypothetical protein